MLCSVPEGQMHQSNEHATCSGSNTKSHGAMASALPGFGVSGDMPKKFIFLGIAAIGLMGLITQQIQEPVHHRRLCSAADVLVLKSKRSEKLSSRLCNEQVSCCCGCCPAITCKNPSGNKGSCKCDLDSDCRKCEKKCEDNGTCFCDKACCKSENNLFKKNVCTHCCAWFTCLWTCFGAVTAPLCYFGLYGGTQATCLKYDWYEQMLGDTGETMEQLFDGLGKGETLSLNYIDNPSEGADAGYIDIERIALGDDKYMFKINPQLGELSEPGVTSEVVPPGREPPAGDRIPIIFAGGRGSFVEKMWNMSEDPNAGGNKIDVGEFPDKEKFTFYTMDYPGYSKSNPGMPGENAILQDYENLYNQVLEIEGEAPILAGYSLGTGTISGLAHEILTETDDDGIMTLTATKEDVQDKIAGMLYMNPFESMHDTLRDLDPTKGVVTTLGHPWLALQDEWDSVGRMKDVSELDIPTMIYSSHQDGVVKPHNHTGLFDTITEQVEGCEDFDPEEANKSNFGSRQWTSLNNNRHLLLQKSGIQEGKVGHEKVQLEEAVSAEGWYWESWLEQTGHDVNESH